MSAKSINGTARKGSANFPGGNRFTRTLRRLSTKAGLWAPLAVFIPAFIVNLVFVGTGADSRLYGNDALNPFFLFMFIYSFTVYYYIVYGIIALIRKRFPGNYRGAEGDYRRYRGTLSIIINLVIFGAFALMPPSQSTGWITLSLPMTFLWGVPGFLFESGVKGCGDSLAGDMAGFSHHPERESLDELRAKGYTIQIDYAVFDQRGGAIIHFDISHPRHGKIHAARFFRFDADGTLDRSYYPPEDYPGYETVLPLPDGRFLYYPARGEGGNLPALYSEKGIHHKITIGGTWELIAPRALSRNMIMGINGNTIVKIKLPASIRDGARLEAVSVVAIKNIAPPGYHVKFHGAMRPDWEAGT